MDSREHATRDSNRRNREPRKKRANVTELRMIHRLAVEPPRQAPASQPVPCAVNAPQGSSVAWTISHGTHAAMRGIGGTSHDAGGACAHARQRQPFASCLSMARMYHRRLRVFAVSHNPCTAERALGASPKSAWSQLGRFPPGSRHGGAKSAPLLLRFLPTRNRHVRPRADGEWSRSVRLLAMLCGLRSRDVVHVYVLIDARVNISSPGA